MSIEIKDLGMAKLKADIKRLGQLKITLGVQGAKAQEVHPEAQVTKGLLAKWLHYGTEKMPARPWVDRAISDVRDRAGVMAKRAVSDLIDRRADTPEEALGPVGKTGLKAVVASMDDAQEWAEPLAASTIARKGHSKPLIDTGAIRDAQTWVIRDGDDIVAEGGTDDLS